MIKRRLIWLAAAAALIGAFFALRRSRAVMNAVNDAALKVKRALAAACSPVRFSVGEALIVLAVAAALVFIICAVIAVIKNRGSRLKTLARRALLAADVVLTVFVIINFTLGASYYADGFSEREGITPRGATVAELRDLTEEFTYILNDKAGGVPRGEDGQMLMSADEIIDRAAGVYAEAEKEFPSLAGPERRAKKITFSRIMSLLGYTGVYMPYTGEANVNVDFPAAYLPDTVAHELAHQRGVASEDEANFAAIVAGLTCGDPVYEYSAALSAWSELGIALCGYDREAYFELYATLDPGVQADIVASNEYWAQFQGPVREASDRVYDAFLKSYGESNGIKTYNMVVGLLLAYYG